MIPDSAPTGAGSFEAAVCEKVDQARGTARAEGYAAGLEAAAKACEGDKTHPVAQAYAKIVRTLGKEQP